MSPPRTPDKRRTVLRETNVSTSPGKAVDSNTLRIWKDDILPMMRMYQDCVDSIEFPLNLIPHATTLLKRFAKTYAPCALQESPVCSILCSRNSAHRPLHSNCSECQGNIETLCSFCIELKVKDFRRIARRLHTFRKIWFYDLQKWVRSLEPPHRDAVFELDVHREEAFEKRHDLIKESLSAGLSSSSYISMMVKDSLIPVSPMKS